MPLCFHCLFLLCSNQYFPVPSFLPRAWSMQWAPAKPGWLTLGSVCEWAVQSQLHRGWPTGESGHKLHFFGSADGGFSIYSSRLCHSQPDRRGAGGIPCSVPWQRRGPADPSGLGSGTLLLVPAPGRAVTASGSARLSLQPSSPWRRPRLRWRGWLLRQGLASARTGDTDCLGKHLFLHHTRLVRCLFINFFSCSIDGKMCILKSLFW